MAKAALPSAAGDSTERELSAGEGSRPPAPQDAVALRERAVEHAMAGALGEAQRILEAALHLEAGSADTLSLLGNVHLLRQERTLAEARYRAALAAAPGHAAALANLGILLDADGRREEAADCFRRAIDADPGAEHAMLRLVELVPDDVVPVDDIARLRRVVARDPYHAVAHAALGRLLLRGRFDAARALAALERALSLGVGDAGTLTAYGMALHETGRFDAALEAFGRALDVDATHVHARFHRAVTLLTLGRYAQAWPDYELRLRSEDRRLPALPTPQWQGEPLYGKTILVHGEQGLGDEILFASCLPEIIAQARNCVIDCSPRLAGLFARAFPGAAVQGRAPGAPLDLRSLPAIDYQTPAGSLPRFLRNGPGSFPRHEGYLRADAGRVAAWRERLRALGDGRKIGLSWRGGTPRTRTERRSLAPPLLAPLLREPGLHFVSLQYGDDAGTEAIALSAASGRPVHQFPAAIADYEETAALAVALDGIVSVCTAIVHLGGALGRPVWVATPQVPEWRYGCAGERMAWYPSVRLVRQGADGSWMPVVEQLTEALRQFRDAGRHDELA